MAIIFIAVACAVFFWSSDVHGLSPIEAGASSAYANGQPVALFGESGVFTTISNAMLFIIGSLGVIMLIVGGLRYIISAGNATAVTAARNTIVYAIIGLVIALLSYALINFILTSLVSGSVSAGTNL